MLVIRMGGCGLFFDLKMDIPAFFYYDIKKIYLTFSQGGWDGMNFYDTHMHSHLSFDCQEQPEAYFDRSLGVVAFTDHLDVYNPISDHQDDIPDFDQLFQWKKHFKKSHNMDIIAGVEVGYLKDRHDQIDQIVSSYDFDLVLLSCHQNGRYDYMDEPLIDCRENMVMNYVDDLLETVHRFPKGQILTHFDYGFRVHNMSTDLIEPYKDKLCQVFEIIIEEDIAFELNSKSISKYNNRDLYEWAIPTYQDLGGTLFSIGSDAHHAEDMYLDFKQLIILLERYKVKDIVQVYQQKIDLMSLEQVKQALKIH